MKSRYSPFELVYARDVRGPLDVLKGSWTKTEESSNDIATYVTRMYECMKDASEIVQRQIHQVQEKQKQWYDLHAREQNLEPGAKVLLLLPDSHYKFTRRWRGPYQVKRKLGRVNYEIQLEQTTKVFHVNLLKRWHERKEHEEHSFMNIIDESDEIMEYHWEQEGSVMGSQLNQKQQQEIKRMLQRYPAVVRTQPGLTRKKEH